MIEVEKLNEVYLRIHADYSQLREMYDYFSCFAPNYRFHKKYIRKLWNGKISFFDIRTRLLPIGLLFKFDKFCTSNNYKYNLNFDKTELYEKIIKEDIIKFSDKLLVHAYTSENQKIDPYDYQIDAVHSAIKHKRGIIESATASGKSLVVYIIIRLLLAQDPERKILFIVPNTSLVEQLYGDMTLYGWEYISRYVTKLYSGQKPDFRKNILCTTWQSIARKPNSFFEKYDTIICDEAHSVKSTIFNSIGKKCTNAEFRLGFTGTKPKEPCDQYNIESVLGPTIFKLKSKELIDRGLLSKIQIVNMLLKYPDKVVQKNRYRPYVEELRTIYEYENRNKIFDFIFKGIPDGQNTLILCTQIEHLKSIQKYLEENIDDKYMIVNIYGKTKVSERETIRKTLEKESNVILVGTYATIGQGFNVKRLHNIIFASSYKSYIKILQSIGRVLRISKYKDKALLFDLVDDLRFKKRTGNTGKNHIYKQFEVRKEYYKENEFNYITKSFKI